jgi:large subunit ribosomal protein L24
MLRKNDQVIVLWGKDKGKQGEVLRLERDRGRAYVSKLNLVKRHSKPTRESPGGIREMEAPLALAKLMLVCPSCKQPTRPKVDYLSDGKKERICRRCGEMIMTKERKL